MNRKFIPVSWLSTQKYCEYQIKHQVEGLEAKPTEAMKKGTKTHKKLELEHIERAEIEISKEDALKEAIKRQMGISMREVFFVSENYSLIGKIDEVIFFPHKVVIIDDKLNPKSNPYPGQILQVGGYALLVKDYYDFDGPIMVALRNREDQDDIPYMEEFSPDMESNVLKTIDRIKKLLRGEIDYIPTKNQNKCRPCQFNSICDESLI